MKDNFYRVIELDDCDVVLMLRGAGDEDPSRLKLEQATTIDGIFLSATVEVPAEYAESALMSYDEETAGEFVNILCNMMAPDDKGQ